MRIGKENKIVNTLPPASLYAALRWFLRPTQALTIDTLTRLPRTILFRFTSRHHSGAYTIVADWVLGGTVSIGVTDLWWLLHAQAIHTFRVL